MPNTKVSMSPVARSVPFDPTGIVFVSTNVQAAIEETLTLAVNLSRFNFDATYNGNGTTGRVLEIATGQSSDTMPFFVPLTAEIVRITFQSVDSTGTCVIGVYKLSDQVTPIATQTLLPGVSAVSSAITPVPLVTGDTLMVKVTSGSRSKPFMRCWMQGAL